jgi:hypothetical protein
MRADVVVPNCGNLLYIESWYCHASLTSEVAVSCWRNVSPQMLTYEAVMPCLLVWTFRHN